MKISLCMICLNEETLLPRLLKSAIGLWDELIIVDTGSSDRTVEIAQEAGAQILLYAWKPPGHKGEARQVGIDAATGDWIVVLDADEVLARPEQLRMMLSGQADDVGAVALRFRNVTDLEQWSLEWYQVRAFRRGHYRYVHREHEIPLPVGEPLRQVGCDLLVEHRPPAERSELKVGAMLRRLEMDVQERPADAHCVYMLARQYGHAGQGAKALEMVERFIAMPGNLVRSDACLVAAICEMAMGRRDLAYEWLHRAIGWEPQRRRWWMELAYMYAKDQDWLMATTLVRVALNLPLPGHQRETLPVEHSSSIAALLDSCLERYHTHEV